MNRRSFFKGVAAAGLAACTRFWPAEAACLEPVPGTYGAGWVRFTMRDGSLTRDPKVRAYLDECARIMSGWFGPHLPR